jgi:hypothetical protein
MQYRVAIKTLAAAMLCTAAIAQPAPPSAPPSAPAQDKAEMQRHFAEMCLDRQAHAVGQLAYLEAKLALTDKQKPLFERWKKVKLATAKSADCAPPPEGEPSVVDQLKHEQKMLQSHLEELKAELPALEALAATLTPEQKKAFAPPGPHHRGPGDHGPGDRGPRDGGPDDHQPPGPPPPHGDGPPAGP